MNIEMIKSGRKIVLVGRGHRVPDTDWVQAIADMYNPACPECNARNAIIITKDSLDAPVDCVCRNCGTWFNTDDK